MKNNKSDASDNGNGAIVWEETGSRGNSPKDLQLWLGLGRDLTSHGMSWLIGTTENAVHEEKTKVGLVFRLGGVISHGHL